MQLELAENNFPYTFVPLREGDGIFIHNNKLEEFLSKRHKKSKEERKEKRKGKVAKYTLAPGRLAFLGILAVNAFGLATKLKKALESKPEEVKYHWEKKLGGKFDKLKAAIEKGATKKRLFDNYSLSDPATATAAATATPVIVSIINWLKKNLPELAKDVPEVIDAVKKYTGKQELEPDPADPAHADKYDKGESSMFGDIPTPVLIGGAALIAFLLFKKK